MQITPERPVLVLGGGPAGLTAAYLLGHPHIADHLDEGLDRLFDGSDLMETGEY